MKKVLLILLILSICFVSSTHSSEISTGAAYYSKVQNESLVYNFSISNEGTSQNENITQIEIILPDSFTFEIGSQGTTAASTDFSKTEQTLIWEDLETYLINGSEIEYFWFDAKASLVGNYSITITTFDINGSDESTILVYITPAETIDCIPNWNCSEWSQCENSAQTKTCTDSNNCNNQTNKPIEFKPCLITCIPNWNCSEWSQCENSAQTKTCTDSNNCNNQTNKPLTTQTCNSEKSYNWLFTIITTMIILIIIGGIIYLITILKKTSKQNLGTKSK